MSRYACYIKAIVVRVANLLGSANLERNHELTQFVNCLILGLLIFMQCPFCLRYDGLPHKHLRNTKKGKKTKF